MSSEGLAKYVSQDPGEVRFTGREHGEASHPGPPGSALGTPEAWPRPEEFHTPPRFFPGEAAPLSSQAETSPCILRGIADEGWDSVPSPAPGPRVGDDLTFVGIFGHVIGQVPAGRSRNLEEGPPLRARPAGEVVCGICLGPAGDGCAIRDAAARYECCN